MITLTTTNGERIAFPASAVVSVREHKPAEQGCTVTLVGGTYFTVPGTLEDVLRAIGGGAK